MIPCLWSSSYRKAHSRFDDVRPPGRTLPLPFSTVVLLKKMFFLRLLSSLLVTCPKYPRMRFSHKTFSLTGSCILLTIEILVRQAKQSILSILHQTHISKASILLLTSVFSVHVSASHRVTEKTSDCISLFIVLLVILLLYVTLRSLVITDLLRAIWRCISTKKTPSASMMEPKYTITLAFPYSLEAVETRRHLALPPPWLSFLMHL